MRVEHWLNQRRQLWEDRFDRLGKMLENDQFKNAAAPGGAAGGDSHS